MNAAATSPPRADGAAALAAKAAELAARAGRPDLQRRAATASRRIGRMASVAVVAGDFGSGKTSLINALAGSPVLPADPILATTALTAVHYGRPGASVRVADQAPGEVTGLSIDDLGAWATEEGNPGNHRGVEILDVTVESPLLREGLVLVDTPGTGGLHAGMVGALTQLIPSADAVVLALDAGAPPGPDAIDLLRNAADDGLVVIVALTKVDLHPEWRKVSARTSQALREAGIAAPVVPVALPLAPDADSGIDALGGELTRRLLGPARARLESAALDVAAQVAQELSRQEPDDDLERREAAIAEGKRRWQSLLQEGFAEISVELDGEVRAGLVRLGAAVDDQAGSSDPGQEWADLRGVVDDGIARLVRELSARIGDRAQAVADAIAAAFGEPGALTSDASAIDMARGSVGDAPEDKAAGGAVSRGLDVVRGSYGGIVLAGVLGQLVALPVAAPLALGAGAVFGYRQLSEQRRKRLEQRRTAARRVLRTHLDETGARLAAATRRAIQASQREVRDRVEAFMAELSAGGHGHDVSAEAGEVLASIRSLGDAR